LGLEAGQREGNNEKVHPVIREPETSRKVRCAVPKLRQKLSASAESRVSMAGGNSHE